MTELIKKDIYDKFNSAGYDVIFYAGDVSYDGYENITTCIEENQRYNKGYLVLITNGGDPNAGYRIARALGHYFYEDLKIFIVDVCKSAGTLICIGGNELIISDRGELGPLDVQFRKSEELFEMTSGLDMIEAMNSLKELTKQTFKEYVVDIRVGLGLGTKLSASLASEMASALVAPVIAQLDPVRLGEHQRALRIATEYGERLIEKFNNTTISNIRKLLASYPDHGFVIDRKEASRLFSRVRSPNNLEASLERELRIKAGGLRKHANRSEPWVTSLHQQFSEVKDDDGNPKPARKKSTKKRVRKQRRNKKSV